MKVYGNLTNRLEEGKMYVPEIIPGTDITIYSWSDRNCYYVDSVVNQKDIFVRPYYVCADQDKKGGMGHQDWLYFKTPKEHNDYLKKYFPDHNYCSEDVNDIQEWAFRNNRWKGVRRHPAELIKKRCEKEGWNLERYGRVYGFTATDMKKAAAGKEVVKYYALSSKVSFGVRDYYYDWEF